jgi:anti-anti-sigma regulatory factor
MLNLNVQEKEDAVVLHCNGALVRGEETNLLCTAVHHHGKDVILDLSGVISIDAGGIGALIALQTAGIYLRLENPTKTVREVLNPGDARRECFGRVGLGLLRRLMLRV